MLHHTNCAKEDASGQERKKILLEKLEVPKDIMGNNKSTKKREEERIKTRLHIIHCAGLLRQFTICPPKFFLHPQKRILNRNNIYVLHSNPCLDTPNLIH
ncbi:hypothetical protein U1Q18_025007 [Sarracenia purpurea var. burkii]